MGQLKTFLLTCLGVGLAAGAGFYLYRKFTSTDGEEENSENTATQGSTEKEDDIAKEDLSDVSGDDTALTLSIATQTSETLVKADTTVPQNSVEKQDDTALILSRETQTSETLLEADTTSPQNGAAEKQEDLAMSQKSAEKKKQKKKSTFGGLRKGFLL